MKHRIIALAAGLALLAATLAPAAASADWGWGGTGGEPGWDPYADCGPGWCW